MRIALVEYKSRVTLARLNRTFLTAGSGLQTQAGPKLSFALPLIFNGHVALFQKWNRKLPERLARVWRLLLPKAGQSLIAHI